MSHGERGLGPSSRHGVNGWPAGFAPRSSGGQPAIASSSRMWACPPDRCATTWSRRARWGSFCFVAGIHAALLIAREHGQVRLPRPHRDGVLLRHHPCDLADVPQVVHDPGREQLRQRHAAQLGVRAAQRQLLRRQVPAAQRLEPLSPQLGEAVEQPLERPSGKPAALREPVERLERLRLSLTQDDLRAGDPVRLFTVDQMAHYVLRAPRIGALGRIEPHGGEAAQHGPKRRGSAGQDLDAGIERKFRHSFILLRNAAWRGSSLTGSKIGSTFTYVSQPRRSWYARSSQWNTWSTFPRPRWAMQNAAGGASRPRAGAWGSATIASASRRRPLRARTCATPAVAYDRSGERVMASRKARSASAYAPCCVRTRPNTR